MLERLLGLELKLRQYETGRRFCDAVVAAGGPPALARAWRSPAMLPTPEELERAAGLGRQDRPQRSPGFARKQRPNARSACYKLALAASPWLQGFHALVVLRCNDLSLAGYKQVFGPLGQTA